MLGPQDIKWQPAPPVLPPGAQIAVLDGTFRLGMGDTTTNGETILQIHGSGPFVIKLRQPERRPQSENVASK